MIDGNVEARQRLGRHQGRHDQAGAVQRGGAEGRAGSREARRRPTSTPASSIRSPGPIKDNDGKERLAAGKMITDDELSKMDYYVEGVQGKLPAAK